MNFFSWHFRLHEFFWVFSPPTPPPPITFLMVRPLPKLSNQRFVKDKIVSGKSSIVNSYLPFITYARAYLLNFLQTQDSLFRGLWVFMPACLREYTERCKEMTISVLLYCRSKQLFHKMSVNTSGPNVTHKDTKV